MFLFHRNSTYWRYWPSAKFPVLYSFNVHGNVGSMFSFYWLHATTLQKTVIKFTKLYSNNQQKRDVYTTLAVHCSLPQFFPPTMPFYRRNWVRVVSWIKKCWSRFLFTTLCPLLCCWIFFSDSLSVTLSQNDINDILMGDTN